MTNTTVQKNDHSMKGVIFIILGAVLVDVSGTCNWLLPIAVGKRVPIKTECGGLPMSRIIDGFCLLSPSAKSPRKHDRSEYFAPP